MNSSRSSVALMSAGVTALIMACIFLTLQVTIPSTMNTLIPHIDSPAYNGTDVGYLQNSDNVVDSILSACNVERDGHFVRSRAKDRETGNFYYATDYSADGDCTVNWTGHNLDRHEIREEGGDYTGYSYH